MTIRELILSPFRTSVLTAALLLLTAHLGLVFSTFRDRRGRMRKLLYVLHLLISFFCLYETMMIQHLDITWGKVNGPLPSFFTACGRLPAVGAVLYEILSAVLLVLLYWELHRYRKNHPTIDSIKQAMDLLPVGVAFGKADGTVAFANCSIRALARTLTGAELNDFSALRRICEEAKEQRLSLPDGSVWQFDMQSITVEKESYIQCTATEITEQAKVLRELEQKHEKLTELQRRLEQYSRQAERLTIAQELLTARIAVHNEVGNVLLEGRHYLTDPASFREERLLQALKYTNTYLLREYEQDDSEKDALAEALEAAELLGVDVSFKGTIPSEKPYRVTLAAAIRESAANAVKHAGGDRLVVEICNQEDAETFFLRTNGRLPKTPIRESGGLLTLRALVEKEGGSMQTYPGDGVPDAFCLCITFPPDSGQMGRLAHDNAGPA